MRLEYRLEVNHKINMQLAQCGGNSKTREEADGSVPSPISQRSWRSFLSIQRVFGKMGNRGNSNFPFRFHRMLETYESRLAEDFLRNSIGIINNGSTCCTFASRFDLTTAACGLVSNERYVSNCCLQIRCSDCAQMVGSNAFCYFRTMHVTDVLLSEANMLEKK